MHSTKQETPQDGWSVQLFLLLLIITGGAARYFHLDAPPLRWDELVVPLTASHPIEYILDWCRRCEVHPPGFHLIVKAFMAGGHSDFILRLPAFISGLLLILIVFRTVKETLSTSSAVVAAALIATDPFLVLFSRQVRPYTLWLCLLCLSCYFYCRYLCKATLGTWLRLLFVNFCAYSLHLLSVIVFPVQVVACVLKEPQNWRKSGWLLLSVALPFAAVLPFLLGMIRREPVVQSVSYLDAFNNTIALLGKGFFPFYDFPFIRIIFIIMGFAGLIKLKTTNFNLFIFTLSIFFFPITVIIVLRYGSYYSPWHVIFIPFFTIIALSACFHRVKTMTAYLIAASIVCGNIYTIKNTVSSYIYGSEHVYEGSFLRLGTPLKQFVSRLPGLIPSGAITRTHDESLYYSTQWYLNALCPYLDISSNALSATRTSTTLMTISAMLHPGDGQLIQQFAPFSVQRMDIPRASKLLLRLKEPIRLTNQPDSFLGNVEELKDITLFGERGYSVYPSRNGATSYFSYTFYNDSLPDQTAFLIQPKFRNSNRDGRITLEAQFDLEKPSVLMLNKGVELPPKEDFTLLEPTLYLKRLAPFSTLTLRFRFDAPLATPGYPGGNLSLMSFFSMDVIPLRYSLDFFDQASLARDVTLFGLKDIEYDELRSWRWATGPETVIKFESLGDRDALLDFHFLNVMPSQNIQVRVNGELLKNYDTLPAGKWLTPNVVDVLQFRVKSGINTIHFSYSQWNSAKTPVLADSSAYSGAFTQLVIH